MREQWAPVLGYEGIYEVSSFAVVRRLAGTPKCIRGRVVAHSKTRGGYIFVSLWKNNKVSMQRLNRVVFQAFNGAIADEIDVHHRNRLHTDNALSNLQALDKQSHAELTVPARGTARPNAILSEETVRQIRAMHSRGVRGR